jgi:hypothetical protein
MVSLLVEILLCYVLERVRNGNRVPEKNAWLYVAFLLELLSMANRSLRYVTRQASYAPNLC